MQLIFGLLAFYSSIAPSMSLGFSAIAIPALLAKNNPNAMTTDQVSWIGKFFFRIQSDPRFSEND